MLEDQDKREIQKMIDLASRRDYSKRVGDTPNDALQLVPRKYVNLSGVFVARPASVAATLGQQYFATDLGYPVFFNDSNEWVDSTGSVIGSN